MIHIKLLQTWSFVYGVILNKANVSVMNIETYSYLSHVGSLTFQENHETRKLAMKEYSLMNKNLSGIR